MKEAPVIKMNHPVLGTLANDQWDGGWLFFRRFPSFTEFSWATSCSWLDGAEEEITVSDRTSRWMDQDPQLLRDNRYEVLAELHSLGVFTVTVDIGSKSREPMLHQLLAFESFVAAEASLCEKVLEALWRYY